MSSNSSQNSSTTKQTNPIALKDYKTYLDYYSSKKLIPMPFEDFLKNYSS
ncbi:hypothetical protein MKD41_15275 [Lutibacter sp. A64]|nr:hypothetical protein [Lutibacter sp. A64]UMB53682.1 hypothetical protein MKD41_15275 [Lutibacter sp. A64]